MGRKPEITELPTRFVMAQLGSGRRWKRILVIALVGLVAAGIGGYFLLKNVEAKQAAALRGDWSALQGCVLGEPLKPGETSEGRVRAIQLTVLGTPRDQRAKVGEYGWPAKCAAAASTLSEHADSAPTGGSDLKASAANLARGMRENANATSDIGKLVELAWKDAAGAGLTSGPTGTSGVPLPSAALFPTEVLHAPSGLGGEFAVASVKPDPAPTKNLRFLIDDNGLVGGAVLCNASGVPTTLVCKHVPADVARHTPGLSLEGTTDPDAQPWIFAGEKGQLGIFRPAGTVALTGDTALGSSVDKDGSAWLLLHPAAGTPNEVQLAHAPLTGDVPKGRSVFDEGEIESLSDATLFWDWILERTGAKARTPLHLVGRKVSDKGEVGPIVDIGDAANLDRLERTDKQERFSACRSGANIAIRMHGARADALTFFNGGVWTAPLPVATRGGFLTCHGNEAVVTQVTRVSDTDGSHPIVEQSRCNPTGCTAARLPIREMLSGTDVVPQESGSFTAAEVGGKLLLVWSAGPLGGLRMRFAPIDRMKATPDVLIADTREDNGQSSVTELRLVPTVDGAILFVNTTTGARLFNVDGTGKLSELHTHA